MNTKTTIVCFGPGPKFKGGIANYNTSLAKAFDKLENTEVHIVSWTQQYPAIIPRDFIDRKTKGDKLKGTNIRVHYVTNYNNPVTWQSTVNLIKNLNPDKVIIQWSIAIQGIPLGYIARKLRKVKSIELFFDMHFVIQKEGSSLDNRLTKLGVKHTDSYVVHAFQTANELRELFPKKKFEVIEPGKPIKGKGIKVLKLYHPVYDMFKPDPDFDVEKQKKEWGLKKHVFLFFGFIRKYKGLHNVIRAFAKFSEKRDDVSLMIVGEAFWNTLDKNKFSTKLKNATFCLAKKMFLKKQDDESIESMGYNFKMPMLVTDVGHFSETVKDGYNGYIALHEKINSMVEVMEKAIDKPINRENVAATSKDMSWQNYANEILR